MNNSKIVDNDTFGREELKIATGNLLGFLLVDLSRLFRSNYDRAIDKAGLEVTPGEARTLVHVADIGRCNQATLAARMSIEAMSVSNYIDRLVLGGFVSRSADPFDRRAKIICLTANGKSLICRIAPVISDVYSYAVSEIGEEEMSIIHKSLDIMRNNLINLSKRECL